MVQLVLDHPRREALGGRARSGWPSTSWARTWIATDRGTSTRDLADRQAALGVDLLLLGAPDDLRVAEHERRLVLAGEAPRRGAAASPTWGAARPTPRASIMIWTIRSASSFSAWSKSVIVSAGERSTGSPSWRMLVERGESPALEDGVVEGARGHPSTLAARPCAAGRRRRAGSAPEARQKPVGDRDRALVRARGERAAVVLGAAPGPWSTTRAGRRRRPAPSAPSGRPGRPDRSGCGADEAHRAAVDLEARRRRGSCPSGRRAPPRARVQPAGAAEARDVAAPSDGRRRAPSGDAGQVATRRRRRRARSPSGPGTVRGGGVGAAARPPGRRVRRRTEGRR